MDPRRRAYPPPDGRRHAPADPAHTSDPARTSAPARAGASARAGAGAPARAPQRPGRPPVEPRQPGRRAARRPDPARRREQRILLVILVAVLVLGSIGAGLWQAGVFPAGARQTGAPAASQAPAGTLAAAPAGSAVPSPAATVQPAVPSAAANVPLKGDGTFTFADTQGAVLGTAGGLKRFRVAVEGGTGQDATAFAAFIDQTLGDARSWIASGQLRAQRVPKNAPFDFTIYLASPTTSEQMCAIGGLHTEKYTSCRLAGQVIINLARWLTAVPDYGASLDVYRAYAINHEVGHEFGHGHEACTGAGRLAPVMQQQTLGLKGCLANAWPYVDGQRYAGPPIP